MVEVVSQQILSAQSRGGRHGRNYRWYVVRAHTGFENKVQQDIERRVQRESSLARKIDSILIPTEQIVELQHGAKVNSKRQLFPGYVLIRMILDDEIWAMLRSVPRISGFVGPGGRPHPISDQEAQQIFDHIREGSARPRPAVVFEVGEQVRVRDGPFTSFNGRVEEIDEERSRLKVTVLIFGRDTPVELEYAQVEKT